ncbi:unnamed protein product [Gongylonema pulchrum]|uniref:Uncharacterized protein n=1 Tax=Gongylonema pulchrum TaxID=637853 RepID=A0A183CYD6_9BILA|nr:unnamed protein product [Gongylonema pulchrum]
MADVNEEQVQTLSETILPVTAHHFIVQHMMATAAAAAAAAAAASTSRQIQLEEEKLTSKNSSHDFG